MLLNTPLDGAVADVWYEIEHVIVIGLHENVSSDILVIMDTVLDN